MTFGVIGGCRGDELTNMITDYVQDNGKEIIVRIPRDKTKTKEGKLFQIDGYFAEIVRDYFKLRPPNAPTKRFFLQYRNGRCTVQVMGKNSIAKIPKEVAKFLGLPNHAAYTGHGFRRTSTTILANTGVGIEILKRHGPWKQNKTCESYIQNSLQHKRKVGSLISNAINLPSTNEAIMTEEVPAKRRAPLMSTSNGVELQSTSGAIPKISQTQIITSTNIAVECSSQICASTEKPVDKSSDALGIPFGGGLHFHFAGPITNFNVNMKQ